MTEIRLQTIKGKPIFHQAAHGRHSTPATLSLPSFAFCPAPLLTICFLFLPLLYVSVPPPFLDLNLPPFLFILPLLLPLLPFFLLTFLLSIMHPDILCLHPPPFLALLFLSLTLLSPQVLIPPFSCPSFLLLSFFLPASSLSLLLISFCSPCPSLFPPFLAHPFPLPFPSLPSTFLSVSVLGGLARRWLKRASHICVLFPREQPAVSSYLSVCLHLASSRCKLESFKKKLKWLLPFWPFDMLLCFFALLLWHGIVNLFMHPCVQVNTAARIRYQNKN